MRQRLFYDRPVFLTHSPAVPTFRENTGREAAMSDKDFIDMKEENGQWSAYVSEFSPEKV